MAGEATGVNKVVVRVVIVAALKATPAFATQCRVIRRIIPWDVVEAKLNGGGTDQTQKGGPPHQLIDKLRPSSMNAAYHIRFLFA